MLQYVYFQDGYTYCADGRVKYTPFVDNFMGIERNNILFIRSSLLYNIRIIGPIHCNIISSLLELLFNFVTN